MAQLIFREHKIAFADVRIEKIPDLPTEMQRVALIIAQWNTGQETFKMNTSGSTGKPKVILLSRDKIMYSARQTAAAFVIKPGDTLFCPLGLHYIGGFMMVMRAMVLDCNLVIEPASAKPLSYVEEKSKIDFASFIPMQMETMLNDEKSVKILNHMNGVLVGGGVVSERLERLTQLLKVPVYHTYAMTETYSHVAVRLLNTEKRSPNYYPLNGVSLSLDNRGCLVIRSFITDNKPLITNDLAEMQEDGSFAWLGRADNIINSGGIKIQLEKIESVCQEIFDQMGLKSTFFAAGIPDDMLGQKLVLVVEGKKWTEKMINNVNDQLSIRLGKYEAPKEIMFVPKLIMTATGKVDRLRTVEEMINDQ